MKQYKSTVVTKFQPIIITLILIIMFLSGCGQGKRAPVGLRCEGLQDPIGLDTKLPRFSWRLETNRTGAKQAAFHIQVASSLKKLQNSEADLWESGWVESDSNAWVVYKGTPLEALQQAFWRVRIREDNGEETPWSKPAMFELGLFEFHDWRGAEWIQARDYDSDTSQASGMFIRHAVAPEGEVDMVRDSLSEMMRPLPLFRTTFEIPFKPVRARAYISVVGYAELRINGLKVSDRVLDPAYTHYPERRLYVTHDVTDQLLHGENAIGIVLGAGWAESAFTVHLGANNRLHYGRPQVRMLLIAEGPLGSRYSLRTDPSWKAIAGPIRRSHLFIGEQFDARHEPEGWDLPGFDDSKWGSPYWCDCGPFEGKLEAMLSPPERVVREVKPSRVKETHPGVFVFELPETVSGWPKLRVRNAEAGQTIVMRVSQTTLGPPWMNNVPDKPVLHYDNSVVPVAGDPNLDNFRGVGWRGKNVGRFTATYAYTCRGEKEEVWSPRFSYNAVRYIEVIGYPGTPDLDDITAEVVHTDFEKTGHLDPGDPVLKKIQTAFLNTLLFCSHGVMQDNPNHERGGWVMEYYQTLPLMAGFFNTQHFNNKFSGDVRANYHKGLPPRVCPTKHRLGSDHAMDWALTTVITPWEDYLRYGDVRILEEHYPAMAEALTNLWSKTGGDLDELRGFGDWLDAAPGKMSPRPPSPWKDQGIGVNLPLHTPISLTVGAFFVDAAHKTALTARLLGEDASGWEAMEEHWRRRLMEKYFKNGGFGSQAGNVHGIALGILQKEEDVKSAASELESIIREEWDNHPNVGVAASRDIAMVLGNNGFPEIARDIFLVEGYPGYLDNLTPPRTTISSGWGPGIGRTVQSHGPASGRYFMEGLAGIQPSGEGPGYRKFILAPQFPDGHPKASARLKTTQGEISSSWERKQDGNIEWKVCVPWNSVAEVKLSDFRIEDIKIEGETIQSVPGVVSFSNNPLHFELNPGLYSISINKK